MSGQPVSLMEPADVWGVRNGALDIIRPMRFRKFSRIQCFQPVSCDLNVLNCEFTGLTPFECAFDFDYSI